MATLQKLSRVQSWPKISIRIEDSRIGEQLEVIKYARLTYYYPIIKYSYEDSGVEFSSERVAFDRKGIWTAKKDEANALLAELLNTATAYVNPNDKKESVIVPVVSKTRRSHYQAMVISGALIVIVSLILIFVVSGW
jgi:Protein of unknown function (DUF3592)